MEDLRQRVFPTCVGMNRDTLLMVTSGGCVPHMRGDEPPEMLPCGQHDKCSPHAWG